MGVTRLLFVVTLSMGSPVLQQSADPLRVPIGYAPRPEGTPLQLMGSPRIDGPGFRATIMNVGNRTIVGLSYVALVERLSRQPVQPLDHDFGAMTLGPAQTIELSAPWLNAAELDQLLANSPGHLQMFLTPSRIRFADGTEWRQSLDLTATDHMTAIGLPTPQVPRALVGVPASATAGNQLCRDDRGRGYSPGAMVVIRDEPNSFARCVKGQWVEVTPQEAGRPGPPTGTR
jgi:hypothetical protein